MANFEYLFRRVRSDNGNDVQVGSHTPEHLLCNVGDEKRVVALDGLLQSDLPSRNFGQKVVDVKSVSLN